MLVTMRCFKREKLPISKHYSGTICCTWDYLRDVKGERRIGFCPLGQGMLKLNKVKMAFFEVSAGKGDCDY